MDIPERYFSNYGRPDINFADHLSQSTTNDAVNAGDSAYIPRPKPTNPAKINKKVTESTHKPYRNKFTIPNH